MTQIAECSDGLLLIYNTGLLVCLDRATLAIKWQSDEIKKYIPAGKTIEFSLFCRQRQFVSGHTVLWESGRMIVEQKLADRFDRYLVVTSGRNYSCGGTGYRRQDLGWKRL